MPSWPTTLPRPRGGAGYTINPVDAVVRTEMDVGASRTRRRTTARNDKVKLSWELTDAQAAIYRDWFDSPTGADGGNAWFTMDMPLGTGGYVSSTVKFVGTPTLGELGGLQWAVDGQVEVR